MKSTTSLVARQCRLQEWAMQIRECQSRPSDMKVREWFPFDATYDGSDKRDAEDAFARTKLLLELGEYTKDDYEYLFWLREKCAGYEEYEWSIGVFIRALSEEYGWI